MTLITPLFAFPNAAVADILELKHLFHAYLLFLVCKLPESWKQWPGFVSLSLTWLRPSAAVCWINVWKMMFSGSLRNSERFLIKITSNAYMIVLFVFLMADEVILKWGNWSNCFYLLIILHSEYKVAFVKFMLIVHNLQNLYFKTKCTLVSW